jgi:hypothetical protein
VWFYSRDIKTNRFPKTDDFAAFITDIENNPVWRRYKVANVINIFKASAANPGYSFLRANQIFYSRFPASITQACEDFAATIIIGEVGYTKCRDSKNVNGSYVSRTDFLQLHIYVIS